MDARTAMRARDLRGMGDDRWLAWHSNRAQDMPVCSTFGILFVEALPSGSQREADEKPAPNLRQTSHKRC
jgi:hypothetical protein